MLCSKKQHPLVLIAFILLAILTLMTCACSTDSANSQSDFETGSNDGKANFTWFKLQVPKGVKVSSENGDTANKVQFLLGNDDYFVPVWNEGRTAEDIISSQLKANSANEWKEGNSVTYGNITMRTASSSIDGESKTAYFFDGNGGAMYVLVDNAEKHRADVDTMLGSIELAKDVASALKKAKDVSVTDVDLKQS